MSEMLAVRIDPWDAELAMTETYIFRRIMELHLRRCNDAATANKITEILQSLTESFEKKTLALQTKMT